MRIVYLNPCGHLGGAERVLLDIFASLRAAHPHWHLHLITGQPGPLLAEAKDLGVQTEVLAFPPELATSGGASSLRRCLAALSTAWSYRRALARAIEAFAPDVIHTNGFKMHLLGASIASRPVIWHIHDYLSPSPFKAWTIRLLARRCSAILAISESVAADVRTTLHKSVPVHLLLNATDLVRFSPHGTTVDLDALSGLPPAPTGTVRVGLVATFARWKGHAVFLEAVALAVQSVPHLRAYIVGGPVYDTEGSQLSLAELRAHAAALGIQDIVGFTGFLNNIPAALRSFDVVVHASTSPEPFGLVIAEAMACGRAVIAVNTGGAAEIVTHSHDALGTQPGNPTELASAITLLALDPVFRLRLGQRARATAEACFSRVRLAHSLTPIYLSVRRSCESSTSTAEISTAA